MKLSPGERVAVQLPNCLAYPIAVFGILKAGCVLVNCNPLYTASELEYQLKDAGARTLVAIDLFADKLAGLKSTPRWSTLRAGPPDGVLPCPGRGRDPLCAEIPAPSSARIATSASDALRQSLGSGKNPRGRGPGLRHEP